LDEIKLTDAITMIMMMIYGRAGNYGGIRAGVGLEDGLELAVGEVEDLHVKTHYNHI
jgi:Mg2+/Co2+ transporter CorC